MLRTAIIFSFFTFCTDVCGQPKTENPGKRVDAKMFYHHKLEKIVMMDGTPPYIEQPLTTALWAWDGATWEKLVTTETQPARYSSGATYDIKRSIIVSFGGRVGKNERILNDTWEWNGKAWSQLRDTLIQARDHLSLCYDNARSKTILFGGGIFPRVPGPWASDTWQWDGVKWTQITTTGPAGRVTAMTYDAARKQVVLFGGVGAPENGSQPKFSDTWVFDGKNWKKLADKGPPPRSRHTLAFDTKSKKVILYGGENDNGPLADMWEWDGTSWKEIKFSEPSPGDRYVHAMAYDEHRGVIVLFGGMHNKQLMTDTWEWNGKEWKEMN